MTELNGSHFADLEGQLGPRTIAILPMGSTEPHGPHLPLDTDAILAAERARRAGLQLEARGIPTLVLPTMPFGVTRLAQDLDGGITLRPGTLWAFVEDVLLSLQQDGVRQIVICNGHHEHEHERILRNICIDYCRRGEGVCQVIYPEAQAGELSFAEEECFGGERETSMMLAISPEKVDWHRAQDLEEVVLELPQPQPNKNRSIVELGAPHGYLGAPAKADAALGERLLREWAEVLVKSCERAWPDLFAASTS